MHVVIVFHHFIHELLVSSSTRLLFSYIVCIMGPNLVQLSASIAMCLVAVALLSLLAVTSIIFFLVIALIVLYLFITRNAYNPIPDSGNILLIIIIIIFAVLILTIPTLL